MYTFCKSSPKNRSHLKNDEFLMGILSTKRRTMTANTRHIRVNQVQLVIDIDISNEYC